MPQKKRYWTGAADAERAEREFVIKRSAGIFASKQFPESAVPLEALYDSQDIIPGTLRVRRGSGSTDTGNAYWLPSITNTPKITGLFSFRRHDGTSALLASIGGGVYKAPGDAFTKLSDPGTLPSGEPGAAQSVAFSTDGTYLAVAHLNGVTIYKRSGDVFTKLDEPSEAAPLSDLSVAFSADGTYFAASGGSSPYLAIYKRSGDVFTKLTNPVSMPTSGRGVSFSADGTYLAIATGSSPFVYIYKRSGDTFTKLSDPSSLPPNLAMGVSFSADGTYLAVSNIGSLPYITIYKRSGDTFTKLADPATLPTGGANGACFSADGTYLSVTHNNSPYVTVYKRSGDVFTKLSDPASLPAGSAYSSSFVSSGTYLAVSHVTTPYITIYKRSGDTFTKLTDPGTLPAGNGYGVAFSSDSLYLAATHVNSPYVTIYGRSGGITGTTLETGLSNNNFEFVTKSDVCYYVNGDNGLRQYDGTTAAAVTAYTPSANEPSNYLADAGDAIHNCRLITIHDNVMLLASPPTQPYRLYRADEVVGPTYFHNYKDIITPRGGEIRWIQSFAGVLIILKSDSIVAVDGFVGDNSFTQRVLHSQIGCAVGRTVQEVPGLGLVFMGSDMHFYVLRPEYASVGGQDGRNVPLYRLSSHISDIIDLLLTDEPAMASGISGNLYTCSVNLLGNNIQKRVLTFDSTRVEQLPNDPTSLFVPWGVYRDDAHRVMVRHFDNALEYLFAASETGIFYFEYPNNVDLADSAFFEFYNIDFEEPHKAKFHSAVHVTTNYEGESNTVQPSLSVDDGDFTDLDTISSYTANPTRTAARFGLASTEPKVGTFRLQVNKLGSRFRYKFTIQSDDHSREILELRFRYKPQYVQ